MKRQDVLDAYYQYSGTASTILRQLGFAGIALVWIFKNVDNSLPPKLIWGAGLIVLGLTLDLLHYLSGSIIWGTYNLWLESAKERIDSEKEFEAPRPINWPTNLLYVSKTITMFAAYLVILWFLIGRFFDS